MNKKLIVPLIFLLLIGICVSRVKYEVVFLRKNLNGILTEIENSNDELKVCEAEWSYLNDPQRLKKLCEKYLKDMKPLENSKIVSYNKFVKMELEPADARSVDAFNSFLDQTLKSVNG